MAGFVIDFRMAGGNPGGVGEDLIATRELAIVPRVGDMVRIGAGSERDEYRKVEDVMLTADGSDARIVVFLEDDLTTSTRQLLSAGWQVAPSGPESVEGSDVLALMMFCTSSKCQPEMSTPATMFDAGSSVPFVGGKPACPYCGELLSEFPF